MADADDQKEIVVNDIRKVKMMGQPKTNLAGYLGIFKAMTDDEFSVNLFRASCKTPRPSKIDDFAGAGEFCNWLFP